MPLPDSQSTELSEATAVPFLPLAVVGMECRFPGASNLAAYEQLLFDGRHGFGPMPADRLDRSLYFDSQKGTPGKTYTDLGGCVSEERLDPQLLEWCGDNVSRFDPVHLNFTDIVLKAWQKAGFRRGDPRWKRTGVYVGHSGATQNGGRLNLATCIEDGLDYLNEIPAFQALPEQVRKRSLREVVSAIRVTRPRRNSRNLPRLNGYTAASLPAILLGLEGPRVVCDAACASSLFSLQQAAMAIRQGRLDAAIVGGATTNGVDNLILFSQSQACSEKGSRPFDEGASGLISSEGYAAVVLVPLATAEQMQLPVLGVLTGLGTASDGRGKSLWAPRAEGQQLAIRRAYPADQPLNIDYLEAHATSTQLGDATELHAVHSILNDQLKDRKTNGSPLLIGSAKSNLGHTLETAGIAGLIKILLAMKRREIPPSLQFERPNTNFDWTAKTIEVVDRCRPWTPRGNVRRSAVSAFGIGGLNAHLTVEEPDSIRVRSLERGVSPVQERIAIVGRGVVLPGGHNLEQFRQLLESGKSVIGPAPPDRWRPGIGLSSSEPRLPFTSPTNQGGYIRDYVFDAQPYRIPPKQVKQSNPIQMMLLDAVTQAIQERDGGTWKLDRQRAGVVIGTVFGGDFGSQLQLGLRLPEIHRELKRHLLSQGVPEQQIEELFKQYRQRVLSERPALLDETGSFTASTLASRVAKTFDLMGGACAIDVDDASGLAGIQLAVDQLRCGHWELAICGAADRSLDLMKFEQLDLQGRLVRSGRVEDIPDDCRQVLPGEGVVVLMLQRLSDALEKKLPILGIIDDVALSSMQEPVTSDAALVRQIGYLTGAQSLVSLIKETLNWERSPRNTKPVCSEESQIVQIQSQAEDHQTYTVRCSSPVLAQSIVSSSALLSDQRVTTLRQPAQNLFTDTIEQRTVEQRKSTSTAAGTPWMDSVSGNRNLTTGYVSTVISQVDMSQNGFHSGSELDLSGSYSFRFSDRSLTGLIAQLEQAVIGGTSAFQRKPTRFAPDQEYRLGLLAGSPEQLESRLTAVLKQLRSGRQSGVFETERAVLWRVRPQATRTAWVFPGQGSQYHELPSGLVAGSLVEQELQRFDAELQQLGLEPLLPKLTNGTLNTRDIWWNQVWVLGLSLSLASVLKQFARKPDVVLGHSFGEYAALVTAGALTVPQVLRMVRARSNAVTMTVRDPGQLISVRGAPTQVDAVLKASGLPYQTTHFNAPQQTVVATSLDQVSAIRETLNTANLASIPVPVPVAYHTSRLADAEELLKQSFAQERFLPATCPVLSATTARYLVEPSDLRTSLVSQMTRPVLYVPAVERLLDSETAAFIEVGPNNVLSRLNQDITGQNALCLSLDVPGKDHAERVQLIRLVQEIIEPCPQSEPLSISLEIDTAPEANGPALRNGNISRPPVEQKPFEQKPAEPEIEIVDLRRVGNKTRESVKADDAEPASATQVPVFAPTPVTVTSPVATPVPVTVAASAAVSAEEVRQFLKTVVVDLTGYSPDVVDFDADLEADLGVDSIKKAQVVGEMAEQYSLDMAPSGVKLGDLKTLDDIARIGMLALSSSGTAPSESASSPPGIAAAPTSSPSFNLESIERFLIDLVVDQTGYSPDVVDLDADMEADLGIDSIKQAQLFGEVQQQFELENVVASGQAKLSSFSTLRSILNFLAKHLPGNGVATFQVTVADEPEVKESAAPPHFDSVKNDTVKKKSGEPARDDVTFPVTDRFHQGGQVRGVASVDEVPGEWKELFIPTVLNEQHNWEAGRHRGDQNQKTVRATLRLLHDLNLLPETSCNLSPETEEDLKGLAAGAGVSFPSIRAAYAALQSRCLPDRDLKISNRPSLPDLSGHVAPVPVESMRFLLRMVPAPHREGTSKTPIFTGPGLVVGNNPFAQAIIRKFEEQGLPCTQVPATASLAELDQALDAIWEKSPTPHLFLTTSHDDAALQALDARHWQQRRFDGLEVPYRVCQRWMQRTIDENRMDGGSVALLTRLGGDFGFSGKTAVSPEGGLAGLIKAMLIECWMRGYRATPMKVIDLAPQTTPEDAVAGIWNELAVPSYDMEVAYHGRERLAVQPIHRPLFPIGELQPAPQNGHSQIHRGGVWVVTGGARGITSVVARELAKRHQLKLHLVGTAPVPNLTDDVRQAAVKDRLQLRREVMRQANLRNENGMEAWRNVEKSIEIDATLQLMKSEGIAAVYHQCDVSNVDHLNQTLQSIRQRDGRIHGIIHGAGIGQDARFDRKRPDKVDQCLRAKIDGCLNLMDATREDRLDWFVSFGSISGRFGANGHTDYSLANDSLAKLTDRYRQERPEVRSVTFHWHAWGDIGMATKPETKLALEMINLEFMPAREGIAHFLHELEHGGDEPEVLITDRNYFRKFFPVDRLVTGDQVAQRERATLPMLDPEETGRSTSAVLLDPKRERFLNQHLVQERPTLPFVVALELMCEGARRLAPQQEIVEVQNLSALQAIKWGNDVPLEVRVNANAQQSNLIQCQLTADLTRRDGRLVAKDKVYFEGALHLGTERQKQVVSRPDVSQLQWEQIHYLPPEATVYHGPDLQCLQKIAYTQNEAIGLISASSTVQLGGDRPTYGWSIHCATLDACLYAAALYAAKTFQRPSLPVRFERIQLGRLPDPGEPCLIRIRREADLPSGLQLTFQLIGLNGDVLYDVQGYQIGWMN